MFNRGAAGAASAPTTAGGSARRAGGSRPAALLVHFDSHATHAPPRLPAPPASAVRALASAHGADTVAHASTVSPEFRHFVVGDAAVSYALAGGPCGRQVPMTLGDPLAPEAAWPELMDAFIQAAAAGDASRVTCWHASPRFAAFLAARYAFRADPFGAETVLDVSVWAYTGKTRTIRRDARQARDAGVVVVEATAETLAAPGARDALAALSSTWLAGKAVPDRALRAFCRAPDWATLAPGAAAGAGGRLFLALDATKAAAGASPPVPVTPSTLAGAVLLDPLKRGGRVVGYFPTVNLIAPAAHQGTLKAVYEAVMAAMKAEGVKEFNLGFAPGFAVASAKAAPPAPARSTWWAAPATAALFASDAGNRLYAFKNLAKSKARWGGSFDAAACSFSDAGATARPVFIAHAHLSPSPLALLDLALCLRWLGFWDTLEGLAGRLAGVVETASAAVVEAAEVVEKAAKAAAPTPAAARVSVVSPYSAAAAAHLARVSPSSVLAPPPSRPATPFPGSPATSLDGAPLLGSPLSSSPTGSLILEPLKATRASGLTAAACAP